MSFKDLQIIHEDNHLIAVNKPGGWLVQGDITGDKPLSEFVKDYIKIRYKKPGAVFLGVIHRLDRPVSGCVLFARTSKGLERMNKLFRENEVQKTYLAIVAQRPDPLNGTLTHFLLKDKEKNKAKVYDRLSNRTPNAKKSTLDYEFMGSLGNHHLLKITPHTGRPHQIRAQLGRIDCPIRGDIKYGYPSKNKDYTIHLHSYGMQFIHPVKKEPVSIKAALPNEQIWNQFRDLAEDIHL